MLRLEGCYDLSWWTVDGGGITFNTGSSYTLGGTAGQPDAATSGPAATTASLVASMGRSRGGASYLSAVGSERVNREHICIEGRVM